MAAFIVITSIPMAAQIQHLRRSHLLQQACDFTKSYVFSVLKPGISEKQLNQSKERNSEQTLWCKKCTQHSTINTAQEGLCHGFKKRKGKTKNNDHEEKLTTHTGRKGTLQHVTSTETVLESPALHRHAHKTAPVTVSLQIKASAISPKGMLQCFPSCKLKKGLIKIQTLRNFGNDPTEATQPYVGNKSEIIIIIR